MPQHPHVLLLVFHGHLVVTVGTELKTRWTIGWFHEGGLPLFP